MSELKPQKLNRQQIEACLKSAVCDLTPDVCSRIDLSTPQVSEISGMTEASVPAKTFLLSVFAFRSRVFAAVAAACICLIVLAGGSYSYQNGKVDSIIEIDVNPSVELSVNRKNRILEAEALNEDAKQIIGDMHLKGVDLDVGVNALIGSMVTHGYLNGPDSAILVTVSNDSISKASDLRSEVVNKIRTTLEEKQKKAVVYDQQVVKEDEVQRLAGEYQISYGKAYFLKELIVQNTSLSMEDMKELAVLNMEEIAREIGERSYLVSGKTDVTKEVPSLAPSGEASSVSGPETEEQTIALRETSAEPFSPTKESVMASQVEPSAEPSDSVPATEESGSQEQEIVTKEVIQIDYVDYENGTVMVHFKTKVKWKNPTVSVKDADGNTYSAKMGDTDTDYCELYVSGLLGGREYVFTLGGISPKIGRQTTVTGIFETPVIGEGNANFDSEEEGPPESPAAVSSAGAETVPASLKEEGYILETATQEP